MPPKTSASKRKANDKWDKENMTTLGCKVKREDAAAFKEYAARRGKTSNTLLRDYVIDCIRQDNAGGVINIFSHPPQTPGE